MNDIQKQQAKEIVDWLATHNKNYTKEQYYKILDLQEILEDKGVK